RTYQRSEQYDARLCLSPLTARLYEATYQVIGAQPRSQRPYLWDDRDRPLDADLAAISADIAANGYIPQALRHLMDQNVYPELF
ncbi:MAG: aromatic amino acid lyase, partial [Chloroflexi bacterium]|nr:aromatic amino acid lyase [Chloroflexota bacterium]